MLFCYLIMGGEGEKERETLIKSEPPPPCPLLYPQLSENLDRQTQGCWPYSIPLVTLSG